MKKKAYIEPPSVDKLDWRLQAATWVVKDARLLGGLEVKKGDPLVKYIETSHKKDYYGFGVLNPTSLFLNSSYLCYKEAEKKFNTMPYKLVKGVKQINDYGHMAVFYELIFTSVVLAFTALEAFANEYIPDNYIYERTRKGLKEKLNKVEIERNVSLDEKLSHILTKTMNVKFSNQSTRWNKYKILKNTRDRIIHMKSNDREYKTEKPYSLKRLRSSRNIWNTLTSKDLFNGHAIAFDIIRHFMKGLKEDKKPRWYKKYPNC